jgi:hypothetical protein
VTAPRLESPATPVAAAGPVGTLFTEAALAASGDWTRGTGVLDVQNCRSLALFCKYNPAAIGGYPHIVLLVSNAQDAPAVGDDSWYALPMTDGTMTEVTLDTGLPSGADFTAAPGWGEVLVRGLVLRPDAADAASDEIRQAIEVRVAPYRWVQLMVAEKGVTASPGTLQVLYAKAV